MDELRLFVFGSDTQQKVADWNAQTLYDEYKDDELYVLVDMK